MHFLIHVDLVVQNIERSLGFYAACFGATIVEDTVLSGAPARFYSNGTVERMRLVLMRLPAGKGQIGQMIELLELPEESPRRELSERQHSGRGDWGIRNFTIATEDLDQLVGLLERQGVPLQVPVAVLVLPKTGSSRYTFVADPDGNLIELVESL